MKLSTMKMEGERIYYRKGSSDEKALIEVITRRGYTRKGFDLEKGERWLDLGANIGAFAIYARIREAKAVCFEPDETCFSILKKNAPGFKLYNEAVTARKDKELKFYHARDPNDHYRNTLCPTKSFKEYSTIANRHGGFLKKERFDGIKLDIEGCEGELLDNGFIPKCDRLVMEYHTSKDPSVKNLKRRIGILRDTFKHVKYPKEFDNAIRDGLKEYKSFFDRIFFAWN